MKKQQGATLIGMLFVGILVVFAAIVVMKLVPAYIEYMSIQKVLSAMDKDPALKDAKNAEVRDSYARRAGIDNITAVKPEDLDISRDSGKLVVAAKYRVEKPLFGNVGLYIDFNASTVPTP
jgi:Tfp pilus assembly major pilin PilA